MSRWAPDSALRLERAALELFSEQGYTATTVPQITARAGLTPRTFFRHFVDKREVLFLREREFPTVVSTLLKSAPPALGPLDLIMYGFETIVSTQFDAWRGDMIIRRAVIQSDEHLRERELLKSSMLSAAIRQAVVEYGVEPQDARVLAPFSVLVFDLALASWLDGETEGSLLEILRATRKNLVTRLTV